MRQFNNQQRWIDFLSAFVNVIKKVQELNVDIFVMAGDIFHKYRPHPGIVRRFLKEISGLDCQVIMIRGNHDSPQILFEKYGGDTLHLIRDVADVVYLNRKNPSYEIGDVCFIGVGYLGFNVNKEIEKRIRSVKTNTDIRIGIFHQLLDYPGVPESRAEVSRGFIKNLGLDYILMGHYHVEYSERRLYNPGSIEYWAFDQAEQIQLNLDNMEGIMKPAKKRGFYIIETDKSEGEFVELKPARPMFCINYKVNNFKESLHLPKIKEHLEKYNIEGAMVKTVIHGRHKYGRINLSKSLNLDKTLIHNVAVMLMPSNSLSEKVNTIKAQAEYLTERGINNEKAKKIAEWLEHNKEKLAIQRATEILQSLREALKEED
jgi:DNA repair exonuclease SbcCD nuclease subunit